MKAYPITSNASNAYFLNNKKNSNQQKNVSFNGTGATLIVLKLLKEARTGKQKVDALGKLKNLLSQPGTSNYLEGIMSLSKIPDSYYNQQNQGMTLWVDSWFSAGTDYVDTMREKALKNIHSLPDKGPYVVEAKKEFIASIIENNHEISRTFFEQFARLNDTNYGAFKEEIIDKCFFSQKYNRIREDVLGDSLVPTEYGAKGDPFNIKGYVSEDLHNPGSDGIHDKNGIFLYRLYHNLKLVSVLDKNRHRGYINQRRSIIDQSKAKLENYFDSLQRKGILYKIPNLLNDYNTNIRNI